MKLPLVVTIENPSPQVSKQGRKYVSFWVRLLVDDFFISIAGWKYYPDEQKISTPSQIKGPGKFINTTKVNPAFYNHIQDLMTRMFAGADLTGAELVEEAV